MDGFRRSYFTSAGILVLFAVLDAWHLISQGGVETGVALVKFGFLAVAAIPLCRKGGIQAHVRLAIWVSAGLALVFGAMLCGFFIAFVVTKGGEGPAGEGAPGAMLVGMLFFAVFVFCPWLLTALRGRVVVRYLKRSR